MKINFARVKGGSSTMYIKKIICSLLVLIMLLALVPESIVAMAEDYSFLTFQYSNGGYTVSLSPDYTAKNAPSELVIPETYNDSVNGEAPIIKADSLGVSSTASDTLITSITYPTRVSATILRQFRPFKKLNTVIWKNTTSITLADNLFRDSSVKEIYIYAKSVSLSASTFRDVNTSAKIHVASEDIKNKIVDTTKSGSYPVSAENITADLGSSLPTPEIELTCDNIKYKTEGGFKPKATVKLNGVAMDPQPTVTYALYTDQGCNNRYGQSYMYNLIKPGTYYLKASVAGTEEYQSAFAVKEVKVEGVDMSSLQAAIDEANVILQGDTSEYVEATVQALQRAVDSNKSLLNNYDATEQQIADATQAVRDAIEGLLKTADLPDQDHINKFNDTLQKYRNLTASEYTEDSWKAFGEALAEMLEMNPGMTSNDNIDAICEKIENAAKSLVKKPLDYTPLETAVNDAKTNYIDKASDLESKYTAETWKILKDAYDAGQKMLADKDSAGSNVRNIDISNAASAINNAISRLITVEQQNAYDALQDLIAEAKAYDSDQYTKSSYKALTDAITEAEKIRVSSALVSSSLDDIKNATENLQKAIDGLTFAKGYLPAGDPIGYVYYGYNASSFVSSTYDGTEPVKQIRYTFDCASDANFSEYASIELQANVNGSQIAYSKITGSEATKANGSKNVKAILDLGDKPIEAGQSYELFVHTYANSDASDYIYAIRKIELLDADGNILKTFNDVTAAVETLKQAIETAENLDEGKYTADSYAKLKEALENAKKAVENEKLTKNEVDAAIAALRDAIRGLVEKTNSSQNPPNSGNNAVKPITTSPTTRSKADVLKAKQAAKKKMKTAKILKLKVKSKAKKTINVTWKKVKKAKGYQVQVSTSKKFKKNKIIFKKYTKKKTLKITKKIKSGKTYYVRVRAYTTYKDINGKPQKVYSKWNKKLRTVKVK